jgi:hypothetical protein
MNTEKKAALKESVTDTFAGLIINLPMNYALLAFGLYLELGALALTLFMTGVFTIIAVVRKYYIRLHFMSRNTDSDSTLHMEQYESAMKRFSYH